MSEDGVLTDRFRGTEAECSCLRSRALPMAMLLALTTAATAADGTFEVPLENSTFNGGVGKNEGPVGWSRYGHDGREQELKVLEDSDNRTMLMIADGDRAAEIGVSQSFPLKGGETYRVSAMVRGVQGAVSTGAYLQLRFLPSNRLVQTGLIAKSTDEFTEVAVKGTAPPDTTRGVIYLYTHRQPTPRVCVTDVRLIGGLPPPPPLPIPPQYERLKDLHLEIPLVRAGNSVVTIVAPATGEYKDAATVIQKAIENRTKANPAIISMLEANSKEELLMYKVSSFYSEPAGGEELQIRLI